MLEPSLLIPITCFVHFSIYSGGAALDRCRGTSLHFAQRRPQPPGPGWSRQPFPLQAAQSICLFVAHPRLKYPSLGHNLFTSQLLYTSLTIPSAFWLHDYGLAKSLISYVVSTSGLGFGFGFCTPSSCLDHGRYRDSDRNYRLRNVYLLATQELSETYPSEVCHHPLAS